MAYSGVSMISMLQHTAQRTLLVDLYIYCVKNLKEMQYFNSHCYQKYLKEINVKSENNEL